MNKLIFTFLFIFLVFFIQKSSVSQFDKPVVQLSFGMSNPYDELRGDSYVSFDTLGFIFIDSSLFANHLGGQIGIQLAGAVKINFDKYSISRGVFSLAFNNFNTFQSRQSGTTLVKFINNTFQQRPVEYNYDFNSFTMGFGLEIAPTSFTNIVSPFFNSNLTLNFLSAELTRVTSFNDSNKVSLSSFRMGLNFNAGIEVKVSSNVGFVAGIKYDLANLIYKETLRDGFIEWGSSSGNINDAQGRYISNIYYPIGEAYNYFESKEKEINWGTAYIGININLFSDSPKKKTKKTSGGIRSINFYNNEF
ncbi:MAG TPA: hypothetical protein PK294_06715 [Ignavibacteria bacterium]|nr:hypothetical protein [Ignavibacteria bacterium]HQY50801.1 hypothetical protein [Ignavibacteria bacterium]HRB00110.1 hypothetical protein [Ignavibacteria bacterium]